MIGGGLVFAAGVLMWGHWREAAMRKRVVGAGKIGAMEEDGCCWLDLEAVASVELTSENPDFPIEDAFTGHHDVKQVGRPHACRGWSAGTVGPQTIMLRFDQPQAIQKIRVRFSESETERSQEFALRCFLQADNPGPVSPGAPGESREIVRQQWTFSPGGSIEEMEEYAVNLRGVSAIELWIDPDRGRNRVRATLAELRVC